MSALWRMQMFNWIKSLFCKPKQGLSPEAKEIIEQAMKKVYAERTKELGLQAKPKRPRLYKQAVVVTKGELPKPVKKAPAKKVAVKKPATKGKAK